MEDIHDPLERYKTLYKDSFRKNVEDTMDEIERLSGIDVKANKKICADIDQLKLDVESQNSKSNWLKALRVILIILSVALMALPFYYNKLFPGVGGQYAPLYMGIAVLLGIVLIVYSFTGLSRKIKEADAQLAKLKDELQMMLDIAWQQMSSVNQLFSWDMPTKLIEKTVPNIHFDAFFNQGRLTEIVNDFGYDGFLNGNTSVLFAHSGEVKGNPFVIAKFRRVKMGTKTYTGYKTIHWTTYVRDANGKRRAVRQSQTLSASVTKPCPVYDTFTVLMYANEAAPNLTFTREPDGLSEEGFFTNMRRKSKRKELEKFSRNLTDDSDYTMMSNQEFEVLFETKDRDNEVEYRLLFTALAQRSIMDLMKDNAEGYGDDFSVMKSKMINVVSPKHFEDFDINTDPARFMDYNFEKVKQNFISFNVEYFRSIYFAFAPLLAIPLYQQTRTRKEIYGEDLMRRSSFWEWESLVNYKGQKQFAHPRSITENILKVDHSSTDAQSNNVKLNVFAHGYSGTKCIHKEQVFGGDGRYHTVNVEWIRYDAVCHMTPIVISENPDVDKDVIREERIRQYDTRSFRRKIHF